MGNTKTSSTNSIEIVMNALKMPVEIPLEPVYYKFLLNAIVDKKHKKCIRVAIARYRKSCQKAGRQLIRDLKKCNKNRR
ncbi:MAG: hypothetical protein EPN88_17155 [Bacteroidetes bacterium]|nr:MAG: hypothetical protein EPN88_17155 [Bacteroidota bacterium]